MKIEISDNILIVLSILILIMTILGITNTIWIIPVSVLAVLVIGYALFVEGPNSD